MKKVLSLLLSALLMLALLTGCSGNAPDTSGDSDNSAESSQPSSEPSAVEGVDISIAGLKGPTSMGLVKLMDDSKNGNSVNRYDFTMAATADEIAPKLSKGELDMAAIPSNLAAVLYKNTEGAVQLLAVNTLGVTYIVESGDTIQSVADLKGKTIYATGKGAVPEYSLRTILSENGIDPDKDVTLEFKTEPTEVVSILSNDPNAVAMLPQPFVTVAQNTVEGLRIALNLNDEWNALDNGSSLVTGVLVVRREFVEQHPDQVAAFLEEYAASVEYVNQNVEQAAQLVESFDIVKAAIAQKAIPYCNITHIVGGDMKAVVSGFLQSLYDQNPAAVGGVLPDDAFYYGAD